ncbi:uncharacterized protein J3D65DRAFT_635385, partial [Phyllosticta citribraziliensis]
DGSTRDFSLTIYTNYFIISDVVRLINVLIIRYSLNYNQFRIYITSSSMPLLISIVTPYIAKPYANIVQHH